MINPFRWSGFWANLHSLLARRRSVRRKLPNRPVVKRVIGGVIDEHRKLATVLEIIDTTHWRGHWGGQTYECRQFPDTTNLAVGDVVVVHAMPGTTELFSTWFPKGEPELWFSPGGDDVTYQGQVWRVYPTPGGTPYTDYTIEKVWQSSDANSELVSHIFWAKPSNTGYVCTYVDTLDLSTSSLRIYKITQDILAPGLSLVLNVTGNDMGIYSDYYGEFAIDPVIDSAQFANHSYLLAGGYSGFDVTRVFKFNLVTETLTVATDFPLANGVGGGIATDAGNATIFAHDGHDMYSSVDGIVWNYEFDMDADYNADLNAAMVTDWANDIIYAGVYSGAILAPWNLVIKRNAAGAWSVDLSAPDDTYTGVIALANSWSNGGIYQSSWGQGWGTTHREVWEKPDGGIWAVDWTGPAGVGEAWQGLATQGLAYYDTKIWGLWYDTINWVMRLYRRDGVGNWTLMQTWPGVVPMYTIISTTGMTPLPSVNAGAAELAAMKRQHEVN